MPSPTGRGDVRGSSLRNRVVVDVDDVVEYPHGGLHRLLELLGVQPAVLDVLGEVDGSEVAHGDLVVRRIQRDFGTQVRRMHDTDVLLRRAQIAGILEVIQGWPVSKVDR